MANIFSQIVALGNFNLLIEAENGQVLDITPVEDSAEVEWNHGFANYITDAAQVVELARNEAIDWITDSDLWTAQRYEVEETIMRALEAALSSQPSNHSWKTVSGHVAALEAAIELDEDVLAQCWSDLGARFQKSKTKWSTRGEKLQFILNRHHELVESKQADEARQVATAATPAPARKIQRATRQPAQTSNNDGAANLINMLTSQLTQQGNIMKQLVEQNREILSQNRELSEQVSKLATQVKCLSAEMENTSMSVDELYSEFIGDDSEE